jgi:transglutaminase-like putative cysteine protease
MGAMNRNLSIAAVSLLAFAGAAICAQEQAGKEDRLNQAYKAQRMVAEYPLKREDALKAFKEIFPEKTEADFDAFFKQGKLDHCMVNGEPKFFDGFERNLLFRDPKLMNEKLSKHKERNPLFDRLKGIIFREAYSGYPAKDWKPYINPVAFICKGEMTIPRKELPENGTLKLWLPHPIQTASQTDVRIVTVNPPEYVKFPPRIDGDLGTVYCEADLGKLKEDFHIAIVYTFKHYEQRFIVDPEKVGPYDKESALYKEYTKSSASTVVNDEIRRKAKEIVGAELNPYRAARKIYDYVVNDVKYSLMPHVRLAAEGTPENLFVHEKGFGDCGSQSMYFVSLCRAAGIPARSTGGLQLVPTIEGDHFWAEFYLPNYGWIPVDTSIAQTADYVVGISPEENKKFKDYFFGNMDPYRLVIQKDVDVPLVPKPELTISLPMAIQEPAVVCGNCETDPGFLVEKYWKFKAEPIDG